MSLLSSPSGHLTNVSRADALRGFGDLPAALLPPPDAVTLEGADDGEIRGRWTAVEGARYDVHLMRDGVRQEDLSQERTQSTSFRWPATAAGTYAIRAPHGERGRYGRPVADVGRGGDRLSATGRGCGGRGRPRTPTRRTREVRGRPRTACGSHPPFRHRASQLRAGTPAHHRTPNPGRYADVHVRIPGTGAAVAVADLRAAPRAPRRNGRASRPEPACCRSARCAGNPSFPDPLKPAWWCRTCATG